MSYVARPEWEGDKGWTLKGKMRFKANTLKQRQSTWYHWMSFIGSTAGIVVMTIRYDVLKQTSGITIQRYRSFCFFLVANSFSGLLRKEKLNSHSLQTASSSAFDI